MIRRQTRLRVADNTGARELMCITVVGRSTSETASVGDVIVASVKQALPNSGVKKGDLSGLMPTPTMSRSKVRLPRLMMSRWPRWIGSNVPV